jgi:hypothetical protein
MMWGKSYSAHMGSGLLQSLTKVNFFSSTKSTDKIDMAIDITVNNSAAIPF